MSFGEVQNIQIKKTKGNFQCGFVQFDSEDAAKHAISKSPHHIGNRQVKVKAADPWHQPKMLNDPPNPNSPSNILNTLKDDCFREIFKYLNLADLSNVSDVCVRFNQLATEIFSVKYKNRSVCFEFEFHDRFDDSKVMFRNFGPLIQSFSISYTLDVMEYHGQTLRMINQYCSAQLKELDVSHFRFKGDWKKLRSLFAKLEKLKMNNCGVRKDAKQLFANCKNLKSVCLDNCYFIDSCISQTFPLLEMASFTTNFIDDLAFNNFVRSNPTLIKLSFVNNRMKSTDVIRLIAHNLCNLQELKFDEKAHNVMKFEQNILELIHLHSLKVLKLNFNSISVAPLMVALAENEIPIEHLSLDKGFINTEAIKSISQFKRLEIIELNEIQQFDDKLLVELAMGLPDIKEIHLTDIEHGLSTIGLKRMLPFVEKLSLLKLKSISNITIDLDDYKTLLKIVQSRKCELQLVIELKTNEKSVDVPNELSTANRKWLEIHEEIQIHYLSLYGSDTESFDSNMDYDYDDDIFEDMDSDDFDDFLHFH